MLFHLSGGQSGIQHFLEHLSGTLTTLWKDLGSFTDWPAGSKQTIVDGVVQEASGRTVDEWAEMPDEVQLQLIKLRIRSAEANTPTRQTKGERQA